MQDPSRSGVLPQVHGAFRHYLAGLEFQPPVQLPDSDVRDLVPSAWSPTVDRVEHLAVGFGAHH